ncbi:MAG TPA: hypothetical protein VIE65_07710 [Methylobacter sp.]|jgi:hypothetical protein
MTKISYKGYRHHPARVAKLFKGEIARPMDVKGFPDDPQFVQNQCELQRGLLGWLAGDARIDRSVNDSNRIAGGPLQRFRRDHGHPQLSGYLAPGQITMRNVDGWQSHAESLAIRSLASPHDQITSLRWRSRQNKHQPES